MDSHDDWELTLAVNVTTPFMLIKAALPHLRKTKGSIVNIGSINGQAGQYGQVNYAASKAGLVGAARSLARELGPRGITANVVAPGFVDTDMTAELSDERREQIVASVPLGRYASPDEVADVVVFLAWFAILFTGRHPAGLFGFQLKVHQYMVRVSAYGMMTTDTYPKFGA